MQFIRHRRAHERWGVFWAALWSLDTIGEQCKTLERLAGAQTFVQELELEVSRLPEANTMDMLLKGVVARLHGELADASAEGWQDVSTSQTQADSDQGMLHAEVRDHTRVQLLLHTERQKHQSVERVVTDLRRLVCHHSSLIDSPRASFHSDMHHAYERCLQSFLCEVSGLICNCGVVYHSDVGTRLGAGESTIRQGEHSISESLDHSLEGVRHNDAPANPQ